MTLQASTNSIITDIEDGLDFLLSHFNHERLFPRKIQTRKSEGRQMEVFSKQKTMFYFKASSFVDCRINAFPSYTEYHGIQRYPPDLIFIDIDRSNFKDDKSFENAISKTKKHIKEKLNGHPTINWSGNGYHILQPIECPILEQIEQFQKYQNKNNNLFISQEFLRFGKDNLSKGKADKNNYPSFKSCQIRIPGSINSKYGAKVKIVQKWNGVRPSITREFIEDFRTYLEQKVTDQEHNNYNNNYNNYNNSRSIINSPLTSYYQWIDKKILGNSFSDYRKLIINLILAPYLIVIKKLAFQDAFEIINEWLQKCDLLRRLDFNKKVLVTTALTTVYKKQIPPMKMITLKTNYKDLYFILVQKEKKRKNRLEKL